MYQACSACRTRKRKCPHRLVGATHIIIPDAQVKPGVPLEHLGHIGQYIADIKPDVVICIGDFADMESLSSYDKGKKSFEGRRYKKDIEAATQGMELLMAPIRAVADYTPRLVMTLGNHEERINRAIDGDAMLDGTIGLDDLPYKRYGWEVHDFLKIVRIDEVQYSHYFCTGVLGRPASSAAVMLRQCMGSAVAGHVQKLDIAIHPMTGHMAILAGVAYTHDEVYLGYQGNNCRRQIVRLNEVRNGLFDPMFISLEYLKRRYEREAAK